MDNRSHVLVVDKDPSSLLSLIVCLKYISCSSIPSGVTRKIKLGQQPITDGKEHLIPLCETLEAIFRKGLKSESQILGLRLSSYASSRASEHNLMGHPREAISSRAHNLMGLPREAHIFQST